MTTIDRLLNLLVVVAVAAAIGGGVYAAGEAAFDRDAEALGWLLRGVAIVTVAALLLSVLALFWRDQRPRVEAADVRAAFAADPQPTRAAISSSKAARYFATSSRSAANEIAGPALRIASHTPRFARKIR